MVNWARVVEFSPEPVDEDCVAELAEWISDEGSMNSTVDEPVFGEHPDSVATLDYLLQHKGRYVVVKG